MFLSLAKILAGLMAYKYALLLPIAIIEGPIVTIIAGFLVSLGYLNFFVAFIVVVVGDVVGDALFYWLGRGGSKAFLPKYGRYFGAPPEKVERMTKYFGANSKKTLIFGKLTHAFGLVILIAAGIAEVDFWEFILINFLGTLPKSLLLLLAGYYFGQGYGQINSYINKGGIIIFIVGAILLLGYLIISKMGKNYFNKDK